MLDIHSNQTIYTELPGLEIPKKKGTNGRTPTRIQLKTVYIWDKENNRYWAWISFKPVNGWLGNIK
jgi:hypothetical protein